MTTAGRPCSTYADCISNLDAGDDIDYSGVSGRIRFDDQGDAVEARFTIGEFREAVLEEVSSTTSTSTNCASRRCSPRRSS